MSKGLESNSAIANGLWMTKQVLELMAGRKVPISLSRSIAINEALDAVY